MNAALAFLIAANALLSTADEEALRKDQQVPDELEGVAVEQKLDAVVPPDLAFRDDDGKEVRLGDYFGDKPLLLTLNYSDCPQLCSLQLNGMVDAMREVALEPGEDFRILTVSINPLETPNRAKVAKNKYLQVYERAGAREGWTFLTGVEANIRALAETVGFRYNFVEETREYAHSAAIIVLTPQGHVARYLAGVVYDPKLVRLALVEASKGAIGTITDDIFLWCFHYDPTKGTYTLFATNFMKLGAALTVLVLAWFLWRMRRFELTRHAPSRPAEVHP